MGAIGEYSMLLLGVSHNGVKQQPTNDDLSYFPPLLFMFSTLWLWNAVERAELLHEKRHKGMELGDIGSWQEDKFYQLDRPNMGHCYIINNVDSEQPATRRDVEQLENTFSTLGTTI